jgi:hypothetical protein
MRYWVLEFENNKEGEDAKHIFITVPNRTPFFTGGYDYKYNNKWFM